MYWCGDETCTHLVLVALPADILVWRRDEAKGLVQVRHRAVERVHELVLELRVLRKVPPPPALVVAAAIAWTERERERDSDDDT